MRRLLAFLLLWPMALTAQDTAQLVADRVFLNRDSTLVAEGNVEVYFEAARLTATRIIYTADERIIVEGPIRIAEGEALTILASQAELDPDLENGILRSARLVLDQQLQVTAAQMRRVDGRYTEGLQVGATSCTICDDRPPIWQIRARRIVHDDEAQQIYFEGAQFRVYDIPVLWFPRLRVPDPGLERATGFLIPRVRASDRLGWGIKVPYFIRLGDHRDLTITPYIASETRTLELRYRQAFRNGGIVVEPRLTRDELRPGELRYGLLAQGAFALPRDVRLTFDLELTSDEAYLQEYGISDKERLDSEIALNRSDRLQDAGWRLTSYRTLRADESNSTQPSLATDARIRQRVFPGLIGGEALLTANIHAHWRSSSLTTDSPLDVDTNSEGLDVARVSLIGEYRRDWVTAQGMKIDLDTRLEASRYAIRQDAAFPDGETRLIPAAALTARYPLLRATPTATHIIEPALRLSWSNVIGDPVPNEDARLVEFDQGNLFALSRSGFDVAEDGAQAALSVGWTRMGANGTMTRLSVARIIQLEGTLPYTDASGLSGETSDWLIEGAARIPGGIALLGRTTLRDDGEISRGELRADWRGRRLALGSAVTYLAADAEENRLRTISELTLDAGYDISPNLRADSEIRYDFAADRTARAKLGLTYLNECVEVELSVSRRYATSSTIEPDTNFGLQVGLRGFGTGTDAPERRTCRAP
ncbi:MAG: LPS-assembly protein LptD [Shimia sp.]